MRPPNTALTRGGCLPPQRGRPGSGSATGGAHLITPAYGCRCRKPQAVPAHPCALPASGAGMLRPDSVHKHRVPAQTRTTPKHDLDHWHDRRQSFAPAASRRVRADTKLTHTKCVFDNNAAVHRPYTHETRADLSIYVVGVGCISRTTYVRHTDAHTYFMRTQNLLWQRYAVLNGHLT